MRSHPTSRSRAARHAIGARLRALRSTLLGLGLALGLAAPAAASIDFQISSFDINPGQPGRDLQAGNCNTVTVNVKNLGSQRAYARVRIEVVRNGAVEYMHGAAGHLNGGQTGTATLRKVRVPGTSGPAQVYLEVNPTRRLQSGGNSALPAPQALEGNRSNNTLNPGSTPVTGTCGGGALAPRPERVLNDDQVKLQAEARRRASLDEQKKRFERIRELPRAQPQMHDISLYNLQVNGSNSGTLKQGSCNEVSVQIQNHSSSTGDLPGGLRMELYIEDKASGNGRLYRHAGLTVPRLRPGHNATLNFRNISLNGTTPNAEIRAIVRTQGRINDPTHQNNQEVASRALQGGCTGGGNEPPPPPEGPSFTQTLLPAFQHTKCQTCHSMGSTSSPKYVQHVNTGRFASGTDATNASNCSTCHSSPANWHAPSTSMSFTGKSATQLCQMTKNFGSTAQVRNHLKQDTLILWAISQGAPPGSQTQWRNDVDRWVNGGMQCP